MNPLNVFDGVTTSWGFTASDVWSNVMSVVGSVAPFLLLGIAVIFAPKAFSLIRKAATGGNNAKN